MTIPVAPLYPMGTYPLVMFLRIAFEKMLTRSHGKELLIDDRHIQTRKATRVHFKRNKRFVSDTIVQWQVDPLAMQHLLK